MGPDGEVVPKEAEPAPQSPWELFEPGTSVEAARREVPALDPGLAARLLEAVELAGHQDRFQIFVQAPGPGERYKSGALGRTEWYNRLVALPLSLSELSVRLLLCYYRQPAAVANDLATIADNAATYNGAGDDLAKDARALADYLLTVLEGGSPDIAVFAAEPERPTEAEERRTRRAAQRRAQQQLLLQLQEPGEAAAEDAEGGDRELQEQQQHHQQQGMAAGLAGQHATQAAAAAAEQNEGGRSPEERHLRVRFSVPLHLRGTAHAGSLAEAQHQQPQQQQGEGAPGLQAVNGGEPAAPSGAAAPTQQQPLQNGHGWGYTAEGEEHEEGEEGDGRYALRRSGKRPTYDEGGGEGSDPDYFQGEELSEGEEGSEEEDDEDWEGKGQSRKRKRAAAPPRRQSARARPAMPGHWAPSQRRTSGRRVRREEESEEDSDEGWDGGEVLPPRQGSTRRSTRLRTQT